jgi:hypothetical protein
MAFCFFDVIPGPPQAEPGIQLYPGSALRAVRKGAPCGMTSNQTRAGQDDIKERRVVRNDVE